MFKPTLFLCFIGALVANTTAISAVSDCLKIDNDLDRLACYDKQSGRTPKIKPVAGKGAWRAFEEKSKLTDQKNVYLTVTSDKPVNCRWGKASSVKLYVRCRENRTSLFFETKCHMVSSDYNNYGDVTYRLDTLKARTISMLESTDNKALGLWRGAKSIPMIKRMFGKDQMIVRMTPYRESSVTATFNISDLSSTIKPLRKACGW